MRPDCAISCERPTRLSGVRDARVVHEHVEAAELFLDALRRGGDGSLIRDVERDRAGIPSHALRGRLAMLEVARPYQHGEAVGREILRDLKTDSFVGPGHQGDGFVLQRNLHSTSISICGYLCKNE